MTTKRLSHRIFSSENEFVEFLKARIPKHRSILGIGDDAAVVPVNGKQLVVTTDSLVEGVHFRRNWASPQFLGKKAARANLSDIAAMGATPLYVLVSLVLPKVLFDKPYISGLYDGFHWAFAPHNVVIVGGNVSSGNEIVITITIIGSVNGKAITRSGARVGDILFCTGTLGGAAYEVSQLLDGKKKSMEVLPPNRIALGIELARGNLATSCIDISDGLAVDLARLCSESKVGARIYKVSIPVSPDIPKSIPQDLINRWVLSGGEDYELLFTTAHSNQQAVLNLGNTSQTPITIIGSVSDMQSGLQKVSHRGQRQPLIVHSWDHIRGSCERPE